MADEQSSEPKVGLDAADDLLRHLEAEQAKELGTTPAEKPDDAISSPDRTGEPDDDAKAATDTSKESGTPSDAEKQEVTKAKQEAEKEGKELDLDDKGLPKRGEDGKFVKKDKAQQATPIVLSPEERQKFDQYLLQAKGSQYAKDFNRRVVSWKELNAEKDAFKTKLAQEDTKFKAAVEKFNSDVAAFRSQQESTRPTPEKYESFAQKCQSDATVKEAEAIKAENEGDNDKAAKLRAEAVVLRADAGRATQAADFARKNPPLTVKQEQEKFQANQKQWIDKAAIDFPEFAKKDSNVQKEAAAYFRQMVAEHPQAAKLPGFIYFCAERAALKTVSDRVPTLEKELVELRAKVKEQDGLLSPSPKGNGGTQRSPAPKKFEQMSSEEQFEALKQEAAGIRR